jgi:hypothetical protein
MNLYRFSPIKDGEELLAAVLYVAEHNTQLCRKVLGEELPIRSLSVFAHYDDEYQLLCSMLADMGEAVGDNNGSRVRLREPIMIGEHTITYLRIRRPDADHPQVGCSDFEVPDYQEFKAKNLASHPDNLRLLVRTDYELIEFFDPDFDVLGYVLSDPSRSTKGV